MIRSRETMLSRMRTTVLAAVAVMAGLCLAAAEPPWAAGSFAEWTGGITGRADRFFPPPAGNPILLVETGDTRFVPLRTGFPRILIPFEAYSAAPVFYRPPFGTSVNASGIDIENTIPFKLLI
jgi:hypothetical protein